MNCTHETFSVKKTTAFLGTSELQYFNTLLPQSKQYAHCRVWAVMILVVFLWFLVLFWSFAPLCRVCFSLPPVVTEIPWGRELLFLWRIFDWVWSDLFYTLQSSKCFSLKYNRTVVTYFMTVVPCVVPCVFHPSLYTPVLSSISLFNLVLFVFCHSSCVYLEVVCSS